MRGGRSEHGQPAGRGKNNFRRTSEDRGQGPLDRISRRFCCLRGGNHDYEGYCSYGFGCNPPPTDRIFGATALKCNKKPDDSRWKGRDGRKERTKKIMVVLSTSRVGWRSFREDFPSTPRWLPPSAG